jgi:NADPH-dependent stearoyl-CoA 9-desaturase
VVSAPIAVHDVPLRVLSGTSEERASAKPLMHGIARKARSQLLKDYLFWPILGGPLFFVVIGANAFANMMRNVWSYMIIFCGHFPDGSQLFTEEDIVGETKGGWYVRQILGSCNIDGRPLFHVMSGNLSFQIEHHLFPDLPSNHYARVAPRVRAVCERYGIPYNSASLGRQFGSVMRAIVRLAVPSAKSESAPAGA